MAGHAQRPTIERARLVFLRFSWLVPALCMLSAPAAAAEFPENPDTPSSFATVIHARDYDERFSSVAEVLEQVAGVHVRRLGGLGAHSTASIRASKPEQVLVLVDGMPLNSTYRGGTDLSTLSLRSVEQIEVVRGGGGARYGSEAMGGVISITTRSAEFGEGLDLAVRAGELETRGVDVNFARSGEGWGVAGSYGRLRSDNDFRFDLDRRAQGGIFSRVPPTRHTRLNADFVEDTGMLNATRELGRTSELALNALLYQKDRGQPGDLAGPVRDVSDEDVSCPSPREQARRALGGISWRERAIAGGSLELQAFYRYERNELHDPGFRCGFFAPDLTARARAQTIEQQSGLELRYASRPGRLGPVVGQARASWRLRIDDVRATDIDSRRRWLGGAFLQQDLRMFEGAVRIIPALGFETARTDDGSGRSARFGRVVSLDVDEDPVWLPRLGLILQLAPSWRLKATALRSYRRPNFSELFHPDYTFLRGNPELEAEDAWSFDAGVEVARERIGPFEGLRLEAVGFHRKVHQSIQWVRLGPVAMPQNTGPVTVRGYELAARALLLERLQLGASYTHQNSRIEDTGGELPHAPRNSYSLRASLPVGPLRLFGTLLYEDEWRLTASDIQSFVAPATTQIDVGITLRPAALPRLGWLPESLSATAEWLNVTGEERYDSLLLPLPDEPLFMLTLQARF